MSKTPNLGPTSAWAASTAFSAYERVILPTGNLGYLTAGRTTSSAWDATEAAFWTFETPVDPFLNDRLAVGQETMHRQLATTSVGLTSGFMRLGFFTARKSETEAKIRTVTSGAAGATPTLCRVGLYTVASNGTLTLVASTANDTSLWAAATTAYETPLSSPYAVTAGVRYAWAPLCVTAATAPTLYMSNGGPSAEFGRTPRLSVLLTGQTDLPSSISVGNPNLADNAARPYGVLLP